MEVNQIMNLWKRLVSFCEQRWDARKNYNEIPDDLKIRKSSHISQSPTTTQQSKSSKNSLNTRKSEKKTRQQKKIDDEFWEIVNNKDT